MLGVFEKNRKKKQQAPTPKQNKLIKAKQEGDVDFQTTPEKREMPQNNDGSIPVHTLFRSLLL